MWYVVYGMCVCVCVCVRADAVGVWVSAVCFCVSVCVHVCVLWVMHISNLASNFQHTSAFPALNMSLLLTKQEMIFQPYPLCFLSNLYYWT